MLSPEIPKGVTIIVKSGENLEYCVAGSKITPKSRKWSVVFIGGKKKMTTEAVEAQNGCPVWDTEVSLDLVSPADPIVMLVLDADKHHIGQVVIPLTRVPRNGPPNFDPSRLQHSELEPTKKNPVPRGRLTYWIWATSYWPPGTKIEHKSKSIRSSLANLKRSKSKHRSHGAASVAGYDDQNSTFSSDARSRAPSMVSGAYSESNLSGETGYMGGGGSRMGESKLWAGTPSHANTLNVTGASYNPFAGCDDSASVVTGRPPIYHPTLHPGPGDSISGSVIDVHHKKRHGILKKMKKSLSQSTHNLRAVAKKAGGDKLYGDTGSMLSVASSKRYSQLPDSTSNHVAPLPNGSLANLHLRDSTETSPGQSVAASSPFGQTNHGISTTQNLGGSRAEPSLQKDLSTDSPLSTHDWGLHPEERGKRPLEEMSHRELVNYALQLERSAQVTRAELARVQGEREELMKKSACAEKDLDSVRLDLADLRVRLLTAGLTEFLERPTEDGPVTVGMGKRAMSFNGSRTMAPALTPADSSQSFLDRLTALTSNTKKLGGSSGGGMPVPAAAPVTDWW